MALPGRLIFTPLGAVWPRGRVTALLFLAQAASLAVLAAWPTIAGLWTFVIVFGAGFGAVTPARAAIVAEVYGAANYGTISGVIALTLAVARALAPAGASALQAAGGYSLVFAVLAAVSLIAGAIILPLNRQALSSV